VNAPRFVAEQLGVEQVVVERGAVRHDELAIAALGGLVDRARHQLLAGTVLALDEHGGIGWRDAIEQVVELLHRRRSADDAW